MAQKLNHSDQLEPIRLNVSNPADVSRSAHAGKQWALRHGFPEKDSDEIALVITELASNLLRHAAGGSIYVSPAAVCEHPGIEIEALDCGPGIQNVPQSLVDGYSTAGGLGLGLGTVNRLMDDLQVYSSPGTSNQNSGTRIRARKWLWTRRSAVLGNVQFGSATRSFGQAPENGDACLFKQWDHYALVGVIDGLGHGPFAQLAAQTAVRYLEEHFADPLVDQFAGVGRLCRATRGVVMALARIDIGSGILTLASIGNIEMKLWGAGEPFRPIVRRGIVGLHETKPFPTDHTWTANSLLIMHSDGLRKDWNLAEYAGQDRRPPQLIAQKMLRDLGRVDDDATVVVVGSAA